MPDEINTGGWCAPSYESFLSFPEVRIHRGGIMYPMPQLDTTIIKSYRHWWSRGRWYLLLRQYGQDSFIELGPWRTKEQARQAERDIYSWYSSVYNVFIRTYRATERNKK